MTRLKKLALAAVAAVLVVLPLSGCGNGDFNGWVSACLSAGGHTSLTHIGTWSDRYECFRDDEIITVPGYEGR